MPKKARKSCFLNSYTLPLLLLTTVHCTTQTNPKGGAAYEIMNLLLLDDQRKAHLGNEIFK